jgi:serralysin
MSTAFRVILEGTQETPPNNSTASGVGTVIFDSEAVAASYSFNIQGVDFGLTPPVGGPAQTPATDDDVTRTHFHTAVAGVPGPIVFGQIDPNPALVQDNDDLAVVLNADGSWSVSGRWETTDPPSPAGVTIADFAATLGAATVGSQIPLYFNVHTSDFPGGEIRGQLVAIADDNNNLVVGTAENDVLPGLGGNDVVLGLAGNDMIQGGDGNDFLGGGDGNDDINTGAGDDLVLGDAGNDNIGGMAGRDTVHGGEGDDTVIWNDPTGDIVFGDAGNDVLRGGDVAADITLGGEGDDLIRAAANQQLATHAPDTLFGEDGNDTIIGGNAADVISGGSDNDTLAGFGGADQFLFLADEPGDDLIVDFDTTQDVVVLGGFEAGFDPLANLSATTSGTVLDLGDAGQVTFLGRLVNEFDAADFLLV